MAQIEKSEVYRVGNKVFDTWTAASKYETQLKVEEIRKNIAKIVSSYRIGPKWFNRYLPFPILFVKTDKYDSSYYLITSDEKAFEVALSILKENNHPEYGFYYDDRKVIVDAILKDEDGSAALGFLLDNSDAEYEKISIEKFSYYVTK